MADTCAEISVALARLEAKLGETPTYNNYVSKAELEVTKAEIGGEIGQLLSKVNPIQLLVGAAAAYGSLHDWYGEQFRKAITPVTNKFNKELDKIGGQIEDALNKKLEIRVGILEARLEATEDLVQLTKNNAIKALNEAYEVRKIANVAIREANESNKKAKDLVTSVNFIITELYKQGADLKAEDTKINQKIVKLNSSVADFKVKNETFEKTLIYVNDKVNKLNAEDAKLKVAQQAVNKRVDDINAYNKKNYDYLSQEYGKLRTTALVADAALRKGNIAIEKGNALNTEVNKLKSQSTAASTQTAPLQIQSQKLYNDAIASNSQARVEQANGIKLINNTSINIQKQFADLRSSIDKQFSDINTNVQTQLSAPQRTFEASQKSINNAFQNRIDLNTQQINETKIVQANVNAQVENRISANEKVNQQAIPLLQQIATSVDATPDRTAQRIGVVPTVADIGAGILPEIRSIPAATTAPIVGALSSQIAAVPEATARRVGVVPTVADIGAGLLPEIRSIPGATVGPLAGQIAAVPEQTANRVIPRVGTAVREGVCQEAAPNGCIGSPLNDLSGFLGGLIGSGFQGLINDYLNPLLNPNSGEPDPSTPEGLEAYLEEMMAKIDKLSETIGVDEYPASLPESLITTGSSTIQNESILNLTQFLSWFVQRVDEVVGQFEIPIEIKDTDPTTPGDQSQTIKLPNIAESIAEMFLLTFQTSIDVQTLVNMLTRTMLETGQDKQQNYITYRLLQSLVDWAGYKTKEHSEKLPMLFTPGKTRFDELLDDTEVTVSVTEFDEKHGLEVDLMRFRKAVSILDSVYFRKINPFGDIKEQLMKTLKDKLSLVDSIASDDDEFDKFIDDVEQGFATQAGIDNPLSPYGQPITDRPKVTDLTKYTPPSNP